MTSPRGRGSLPFKTIRKSGFLLVLALLPSVGGAHQDFSVQSLPVPLGAYEGALITAAYWGVDGIRVETWCERNFTRPGKQTSASTDRWTFSQRTDSPKASNPNPEHMVNAKVRFD